MGSGKKIGIGIGVIITIIAIIGLGGQQSGISSTKSTISQPQVQQERPRCDPSYPTVCIPPYPPDLDCGEISYKNFKVLPPDPHGFDRDNDGVGCEQ